MKKENVRLREQCNTMKIDDPVDNLFQVTYSSIIEHHRKLTNDLINLYETRMRILEDKVKVSDKPMYNRVRFEPPYSEP